MKRLAVLLALVMTVGLVGCGNSGTQSKTESKSDTKEEATTETKTPGKRKILPSTGQETSYLALFGVAVATMSLVLYKKKKMTH